MTLQQVKDHPTSTQNPPEGCPFVIGQKVMFKNDAGLVFGPYRIFAFEAQPSYGRCVYIDKDSYWFPCEISSLNAA